MRRRSHRIATLWVTLSLVAAPGVRAQTEAAESLCAALTPGEVRGAVDVNEIADLRMEARQDVTYCQWTSKSPDLDAPIVSVSLNWSDLGLEETRALAADGTIGGTLTDLTIGGRPALLKTGTVPFYVLVELDQGVLQMTASDQIGTDFSDALVALGEIAVGRADTLVPLPVIDSSGLGLPEMLRDQAITWDTRLLDEVFAQGDDRRRELRQAVEAQDASLSDVTIASGIVYLDEGSVILNAFRVAGADITKLADFAVNASGLWGGYTLPDGITNGGVSVIETPSGDEMLLYPRDDTAWIVLAEGTLADEALAVLPGGPARQTVTPPVEEPVEPNEPMRAGGDPVEILGGTLAGETLTTQTDDLDGGFMDPRSRTYKTLTKALKANDMELSDARLTLASSASGEFGVTALEVGSADASAFVDFTVVSLVEGAQLNPNRVKAKAGQVAGKAVSILTLKRGGQTATAYIYPQGNVVWSVLTQGDAELAEEIVSALP